MSHTDDNTLSSVLNEMVPGIVQVSLSLFTCIDAVAHRDIVMKRVVYVKPVCFV